MLRWYPTNRYHWLRMSGRGSALAWAVAQGYIADEQRLDRMLDYDVIVPRLQRLYEWSAEELAEERLPEFIHDGNPVYARPVEERHVWHTSQMPFAARALRSLTQER